MALTDSRFQSPRVQRVGTQRCLVGEGPVWDSHQQQLYFVDLLACRLWCHEPSRGGFRDWQLPSLVGSLALREGGGVLVALQDGLHSLNLADGALEHFANLPSHPDTQCNDGKVDPRGRFLVGTQPRSLADRRSIGGLYALEPDRGVRTLDEGFCITNGPCWSPDGRTFYFADSLAHTIYAYDYDLDSGDVTRRRVFAEMHRYGGIPDGAACDTEGRLWVAVCGGGKVVCLQPDGIEYAVVEMPVPMVGSVCFGGPELDRLYVTTLDGGALGLGLPADDLGGALFVVDDLGARGLPDHRYAG